jgi:PTS system N-acetylglucosamine-specific IIC component
MAGLSAFFQMLGRTLMLPIAVLPIAGLILRLGQPDLLHVAFMAEAGGAIFANLGLLFAIGVAVGFARENHGAAALAGLVCYLVATHGAQALVQVPPATTAGVTDAIRTLVEQSFREKAIGKLGVPLGILSGVTSGLLYNRYSDIKLPEFLAFFGGRRFVPILAGCAGLVFAAAFGLGWPYLEAGIDLFSQTITRSGEFGLFVYGVLNRVLVVTGLHHILNNVAWFIIGDFHGATGDINRFFAGDKTAGSFMSGFFPVMMFGLPAACLAMYRSALPGQRKAVAGIYLSLALTSFLTGVTEPIEFTFMFVAPVLYVLHAVLTGIAMALMDMLGVKLGFGFSAGLFDYLLNFGKATRPLMLVPVGLIYAAIYYGVFRFFITRFDLKTPGRGDVATVAVQAGAVPAGGKADAFIHALGGAGNIRAVEACTTRLRLVIENFDAVDAAALQALGSRGMIRPSGNALQVVLGPSADQMATAIRRALPAHRAPTPMITPASAAPSVPPPSIASQGTVRSDRAEALAAALGGSANLAEASTVAGRLMVRLIDRARVRDEDLRRAAPRGVAWVAPDKCHVLLDAAALADMAALTHG